MQSKRYARRTLAVALALMTALNPAIALAKGSSGGYSRPSVSVRAPSVSSFSAPRASAPAAPSPAASGSGGYFRPAQRTPTTLAPSTSAGDAAINGRASADALREMRSRPAAIPPREAESPSPWNRERTPSASTGGSFSGGARDTFGNGNATGGGSFTGGARQTFGDKGPAPTPPPAPRSPGYGGGYGGGYAGGYGGSFWNDDDRRRTPPVRPTWSGAPGWSAPSWASQRTSAGPWNALMLWFFLDTLTRPGHSEWFRQHRDDPGYREWRRQADQEARSNPDLKGKLDGLDSELGQPLNGPAQANYLPPDVKPEQAKAPEPSHVPAWPFVLLVLLLAGGLGWWFLLRRRETKPMDKSSLSTLAGAAEGVARNKLGKARQDTREPFRVGQVVDVDTTPFLLGRGKLLSETPPSGKQTVTDVGVLDGLPLTRLHLSEDRFVQVHLSGETRVDECRLFSLLDEVRPSEAEEWRFWLPPGEPDDATGVPTWAIGFPTFETKDGKAWSRVWRPGQEQVPPMEATERLRGGGERSLSTMLYARDTGVPEPGPSREYLLLEAVTQGDDARVAIMTGVDIDTAGLNLTP